MTIRLLVKFFEQLCSFKDYDQTSWAFDEFISSPNQCIENLTLAMILNRAAVRSELTT